MSLYDVVEKLSDDRQMIIFRLALDMLAAQQSEDFDYFSPEDTAGVKRAIARQKRGDCVSFASAAELAARFGISAD